MPGRDLSGVAAQLRTEGLPAGLPCVIVSRAAQPDQQIVETTLGQLDRIGPVPAPSILLAGEALRNAQAEDVLAVSAAVQTAAEQTANAAQ